MSEKKLSYISEIKLPVLRSIIYCQNVLLDRLFMYDVKIVFHFFCLLVFKSDCICLDHYSNATYLPNILESAFEKSQSVMGGKFFFFRKVFELSTGSSSDLICWYEALVQ